MERICQNNNKTKKTSCLALHLACALTKFSTTTVNRTTLLLGVLVTAVVDTTSTVNRNLQ
eukprot:SAG11_NODE_28032_length_326_cov_0.687225_1_plen_60_part_00